VPLVEEQKMFVFGGVNEKSHCEEGAGKYQVKVFGVSGMRSRRECLL